MIEIIDALILQAQEKNWGIKYVALSKENMKKLAEEVSSFGNLHFTIGSISAYKGINIKEKDIVGFQVAYNLEDPLPF